MRVEMVRRLGRARVDANFVETHAMANVIAGHVRCGRRENDVLMWRGVRRVAREDMQRAR